MNRDHLCINVQNRRALNRRMLNPALWPLSDLLKTLGTSKLGVVRVHDFQDDFGIRPGRISVPQLFPTAFRFSHPGSSRRAATGVCGQLELSLMCNAKHKLRSIR